MANATKYVDNVNGNNANTGNSEAQAYADLATALAAVSGGGNVIHVQSGSNYTLTSALSLVLVGDTTNGRNRIEGYTTTPGARDGRPTITCATNGVAIFACNSTGYVDLVHLNVTHTAGTRGALFSEAVNPPQAGVLRLEDCVLDGLLDINGSQGHPGGSASSIDLYSTDVKNFTTTGNILYATSTSMSNCRVWANANATFWNNGNANDVRLRAEHCIFAGGVRAVKDDTASVRATYIALINNTFYGHSGDAVKIDNFGGSDCFLWLENNLFYGNGGYGVNSVQSATRTAYRTMSNQNNAYGGNTSGARNNLAVGIGDVSISVDPFVDASTKDFTLNLAATGGGLARNAGLGGFSIGALQSTLTPAQIAAAIWARAGRTLT